jgi:hypothetical protein
MINSFKITTLLFGLLNIGFFILWLWDFSLMGTLLGVEILGERNLIPFLFLALGLFSIVSSMLSEAKPRVMLLLVILIISLATLFVNVEFILKGELKGMTFISTSFIILGITSLWNESKFNEPGQSIIK